MREQSSERTGTYERKHKTEILTGLALGVTGLEDVGYVRSVWQPLNREGLRLNMRQAVSVSISLRA